MEVSDVNISFSHFDQGLYGCPRCNPVRHRDGDFEPVRGGLCSPVPNPLFGPGHYAVRGLASFGQDEGDWEPNIFHCDLTGRAWNGDPEPAGPRPVRPHPAAPARPTLVSSSSLPVRPAAKGTAGPPAGVKVRPLKQSNDLSCGQTSVAMSVNYLTGKRLTDRDIDRRYGFGLLHALKTESKGSGYTWYDAGNFSKKSWPMLEKRLNKERTPVLIGLNGPVFSPSGRGHIITLLSIDGDTVRYADPGDGQIKTTTRRAIEQAGGHPDGKFLFCTVRDGRA